MASNLFIGANRSRFEPMWFGVVTFVGWFSAGEPGVKSVNRRALLGQERSMDAGSCVRVGPAVRSGHGNVLNARLYQPFSYFWA